MLYKKTKNNNLLSFALKKKKKKNLEDGQFGCLKPSLQGFKSILPCFNKNCI